VDQATLVAEKLRVAVARLKMLHEASTYGVVTISIGVARGDTGEGLADDRLREADGCSIERRRTAAIVSVRAPQSTLKEGTTSTSGSESIQTDEPRQTWKVMASHSDGVDSELAATGRCRAAA
jgi:hypothetical protein